MAINTTTPRMICTAGPAMAMEARSPRVSGRVGMNEA
jgi:hypothetical protein